MVYPLSCYLLSVKFLQFSHMLNHCNHFLQCRFNSCTSHVNLKCPEAGHFLTLHPFLLTSLLACKVRPNDLIVIILASLVTSIFSLD